MHGLLQSFATISALLSLIQLPTLRLCTRLLAHASQSRGRSAAVMETQLLVHEEEVTELLHVDLSRTPPEAEPGAPRMLAAHHVEDSRGRGTRTMGTTHAHGHASNDNAAQWHQASPCSCPACASEVWSRSDRSRTQQHLSALKLT
jgi:hypothetical protein